MGHADEKIAVLDDKNNVIGYKLYSELTDDDLWKIISVWIEDGKGNALMQQRSFKKRLGPGLWTPAVEGTVDGDDSYEETAIREIEEEIGLPKSEYELIPSELSYYRAEYGSRVCQGYKIIGYWPLEKLVPQEEEVEQLAWLPIDTVVEEIKAGDPKYPSSAKIWLKLFNLG